jgi:hypothetical protein
VYILRDLCSHLPGKLRVRKQFWSLTDKALAFQVLFVILHFA